MWIRSTVTRLIIALVALVSAVIITLPTLESLATGKPNEQLRFSYLDPIKLGLDLKGGMYLQMQVLVDRAVDYEVDRLRKNLAQALADEGIEKDAIRTERVEDAMRLFRLSVPSGRADQAADFINENYTVLNISGRSGEGDREVFELEWPADQAEFFQQQAVEQALDTIRNRIDEFGVAEPSITKQGTDRIVIQLPGELNAERIRGVINRTAFLEFKILDEMAPVDSLRGQLIARADEVRTEMGKDFDTKAFLDKVNASFAGQIPAGDKVYFGRTDITDKETGQIVRVNWTPYILKDETVLTGAALSDARVQFDQQFGSSYVSMSFNPDGAREFEDLTGANVGKQMAIILDGVVHSAPVIQDRIAGGQAQISGQFTPEQARDLAIVLRSGSLPAEVKTLRQSVVGAGLGRDSIESGSKAALLGAILVIVFMLVYYRGLGLTAVLALSVNVLIILSFMVWLGATLTLPGIAGLALTMGMAVDANVLIFERIREEVNSGKGTRQAIEQGFDRAFVTILDANITTLLTGLVLFQYGVGPVRGFAATLCLGIISSVFTSVFIPRTLLAVWMDMLKQKFEITGSGAGEAPVSAARAQS